MKKLFLVLALALILGFTTSALGATFKILNWTSPTTNVDGTPLTDLAGFELSCGNAAGAYMVIKDVGILTATATGGQAVQYSTAGTLTTSGTWYCVVIVYDTSGNKSVYSNETSFPLDFNIAPAAVTDLR